MLELKTHLLICKVSTPCKTWYGEALPKTKQMPRNTDNDTQRFYQYVLNTLSAADFNTLYKQLSLSKRMTTIRLQKPNLMNKNMIQKLAKILNNDLVVLVNEYELGYDILTVREYNQLVN